jgi:hypothetical protein
MYQDIVEASPRRFVNIIDTREGEAIPIVSASAGREKMRLSTLYNDEDD